MSDFESKMEHQRSSFGRAKSSRHNLLKRLGVKILGGGMITVQSMDTIETWRVVQGGEKHKDSLWEMVSREKAES